MTDRLYYHDSFLYDFDAEVARSPNRSARPSSSTAPPFTPPAADKFSTPAIITPIQVATE